MYRVEFPALCQKIVTVSRLAFGNRILTSQMKGVNVCTLLVVKVKYRYILRWILLRIHVKFCLNVGKTY